MFKSTCLLALLVCCVAFASATVFFKEDFGEGWESRWVKAYPHKDEDSDGEFEISSGKYFGDEEAGKGLKTSEDAKFYTISAKFDEEFSNKDKTIIFQYSVKHEQKIDCGGAYIKIFPAGFDQENLNDKSDYNIMFGPDICGSSTKRTHVIFNNNGENHLIKKEIRCEDDDLTHLYALHVFADNTYKVFIDGEEKQAGSLADDWDMLEPKEIKDPEASKPEDWVDEKEIVDPEDEKPEGWDDIEKEIADPDAEKPEDWDDELDGDWEAPMIPNPEYKGEWKPKMIPNPEYKGEWEHPMVPNPDYKDDPELYAYDSFGGLAVEVWQVKSGTIFDNFLVTDSEDEAKEATEAVKKFIAAEKEMKEKVEKEEREKAEAERKAEEEKKAAEEAAKAEEEGDSEDDAEEAEVEESADNDEL